jgi:hypothetical protein
MRGVAVTRRITGVAGTAEVAGIRRVRRGVRAGCFCAWLLVVLAAGAPAKAEGFLDQLDHRGGQAFDLIVVRPLSALRVVVGFGLFIPAGLFAGDAETTNEAWDIFVAEPFDATFKKPLGEIEEEY